MQVEKINEKNQLKVRGTAKTAVLEGGEECPNKIASWVYDSQPVHYLSINSEDVKRVGKSKEVYNVDTDEVKYVKDLRMGLLTCTIVPCEMLISLINFVNRIDLILGSEIGNGGDQYFLGLWCVTYKRICHVLYVV